MVAGKSIEELIGHIRDSHHIGISGDRNKADLLNMGYYHGYKGYRFIGSSQNKVQLSDFDQVVAIYTFDANLKSLLYPHIMFFETAIQSRTLDSLIQHDKKAADFEYIFINLLTDYKKYSVGNHKYRDKMKQRLELRNRIYKAISDNYIQAKPVIQHFYHNNKMIPLWAIFEVLSLGEFGLFFQCLNEPTRVEITKGLNMHSIAHNNNGRILGDMIFLIKDMRNAVAHNAVVFDCRFRKINPPSRLKEYLQGETGIENISFENLIDYFILLVFILKRLSISNFKLQEMIDSLVCESEKLRLLIPVSVHASIMSTDFRKKTEFLKRYIMNEK